MTDFAIRVLHSNQAAGWCEVWAARLRLETLLPALRWPDSDDPNDTLAATRTSVFGPLRAAQRGPEPTQRIGGLDNWWPVRGQ
jgi:hypothetical protein